MIGGGGRPLFELKQQLEELKSSREAKIAEAIAIASRSEEIKQIDTKINETNAELDEVNTHVESINQEITSIAKQIRHQLHTEARSPTTVFPVSTDNLRIEHTRLRTELGRLTDPHFKRIGGPFDKSPRS